MKLNHLDSLLVLFWLLACVIVTAAAYAGAFVK